MFFRVLAAYLRGFGPGAAVRAHSPDLLHIYVTYRELGKKHAFLQCESAGQFCCVFHAFPRFTPMARSLCVVFRTIFNEFGRIQQILNELRVHSLENIAFGAY